MSEERKEKQIVVVLLDKEQYGIEIHNVQEIIKLSPVTKLPGTEDYIMGIMNLRGSIIPVIDLKKKFNLSVFVSDDARIVVVEVEDRKTGFVVDAVTEVIMITEEQIQSTTKAGVKIESGFVKGVVNLGERLLIMLNVKEITK